MGRGAAASAVRAVAVLAALLAGCAGSHRELCGVLADEVRAVREKSRECELPPSTLAADSCPADTSACTDQDRTALAAEASCVEHLPSCNDARSCRGDACADAVPGAADDWQRQLDACRQKSAAVSPACRAAIARGP